MEKKMEKKITYLELKECPTCGKLFKKDAEVCKYCATSLEKVKAKKFNKGQVKRG